MRLIKLISAINERCGKIISWVVVIITLLVVFEVVTRRFFENPTIWTFDVITQMYGIYFVLLIGYALLYDAHVAVDVFYVRFSKRTKAILNIVTYICFFFPWIFAMIWQGASLAMTSLMRLETAFGLFAIPLYPAKIALFIGVVLLFLQGICKFSYAIMDLRNCKEGGV